jgi:hypothetical protein
VAEEAGLRGVCGTVNGLSCVVVPAPAGMGVWLLFLRNASREYKQDRNRIREDAVMLTKVRKKQLDTDLWIIAGVSLLVLVIYIVFGREIDNIAVDTEIPIVLRVLFMGGIFQFGIAGLGITIVAIVRKERFSDHGLTRKHLLPAIALSALCCVPISCITSLREMCTHGFPFPMYKRRRRRLRAVFRRTLLPCCSPRFFTCLIMIPLCKNPIWWIHDYPKGHSGEIF